MANWNNPLLTSTYTNFMDELKGRDDDAASMAMSPTTPPTGYVRLDSVTNMRFEKWSGSAWVVFTLGLLGGGTGATTASGARTNLGLGTIATQDAATVNITGGTVQGILQAKGGSMTFDADGTRDVGTNAVRPNRLYIRNALVIPVGTDKYATS